MLTFEDSDLRRLGNTGLRVSPLGLGTVKFGRNTDVKYPHAFSLPTDAELSDLLAKAHDLGINLLDTAPAYGNSESRLGKLLVGQRDKWLVCSKAGEQYIDGQSNFDFSANGIQASIDNSLKNLQTDYLDLLLVHLDDEDEQSLRQNDIVGELRKAQAAGKARFIGASTKTVAAGMLVIEDLDILMMAYSLQDRSQIELLAAASERDKGILAKKILSSGHAANTKQCLEFIAKEQRVHSAIVGTIDAEHLSDNVAAMVSAKL